MLESLSRRLVLSHILPLLIIVPLTGLALIYALETQVLLPNRSRELLGQAMLVAELARDDPRIWSDGAVAAAFLTRIDPQLEPTVRLVDREGRLLGSTDAARASELEQVIPAREMDSLLSGKDSGYTAYDDAQQTERLLAEIPVKDGAGRVLGIVQLASPVDINRPFAVMRSLIAGILAAGLVLGAVVASVLAMSLARPLQEVTQAIAELGEHHAALPLHEEGPSEMRGLVRAFNMLADRLQTTEDAQRRLLANLVHELGRPLGSLRSAIQALLNGAADDVALRVELLAGMEEVVQRMERLLADLTQLHDRIEGHQQVKRQPVAMSDWLVRCLSVWREAAHAKGLRWEAIIPPDLPVVAIDPDRFGQALGNVLSNAVKYTGAGGSICVTAGVKDQSVWISIEDTGPGISIEEQGLIFTPLYRSRQLHRFPQGMGLGLPIARALIEAHGGRLELHSAPGDGSRFTLWLPPGAS